MNYIEGKKIEPEKSSKISVILLVLLILYIFFILGQSVWRHYQINLEIKNLKTEIVNLEDQIKQLEEQIKYYQTTAFKEKEARAKLGYVKPGEKAVAIPSEKKTESSQESQKIPNLSTETEIFKIPNYYKWWDFLFVD